MERKRHLKVVGKGDLIGRRVQFLVEGIIEQEEVDEPNSIIIRDQYGIEWFCDKTYPGLKFASKER